MGAELDVSRCASEIGRPGEVLLRGLGAAGVVSHPAGHFGEGAGRRENFRPSRYRAEESGCYCGLQVVHHGRVEVTATDLEIGCAEGLHRRDVRAIVWPLRLG